jgi:hypothetical protein
MRQGVCGELQEDEPGRGATEGLGDEGETVHNLPMIISTGCWPIAAES